MASQYDKDVVQIKKLLLMTSSAHVEEADAFIRKAVGKMMSLLSKLETENQKDSVLALFSRVNIPHVAYGHQNRQRRVKNSSFKVQVGDGFLHFDTKGTFLAIETAFGKIQQKKDYETLTSITDEEKPQ